jgi:hypothetical protein
VRFDFVGDEIVNGAAPHALFLVQVEVHLVSPCWIGTLTDNEDENASQAEQQTDDERDEQDADGVGADPATSPTDLPLFSAGLSLALARALFRPLRQHGITLWAPDRHGFQYMDADER